MNRVLPLLAAAVLGAPVPVSAGASSLGRDLEFLLPSPGPAAPASRPRGEGSPFRLASAGAIRAYRFLFSSQSGNVCGFTPGCSRFTEEAIHRHGFRGLLLGSDRILRCHWFELDHYPVDPATGRRFDPVDAYSGSPVAVNPPAPDLGRTARAAPEEPDRTGGGERRSLRKFADHLASEGDWLRAATEYRRCLHDDPTPPAADTLSFLVGVCLRRGGEPDRAVRALEEGLGRPGRGAVDARIAREIALTHYGAGRPEEGERFLDRADSGRGWMYGTLAGGFYLGNVYGSVIAARAYNEGVESNLRERTLAAIAGGPVP